MSQSLLIRFAEQVSATETTSDRLKAIADHLGLSQNKAAHIAINALYNEISADAMVESEFQNHGRQVGRVTYLHAPDDLVRRVEERIAAGTPLPHEDDESLERNLLFVLLSTDQKRQVKATPDPLQKRHLIARFVQENRDRP